MMNVRSILSIFALALLLVGCHASSASHQSEASATDDDGSRPVVQSSSVPSVPYADLVIAQTVDMGTFEGDQLKKTMELTFENKGTAPLVITHAMPDCDCTEILAIDSVVAPNATGSVTVSLDLSGYPADTIRKDFGILSNDYQERATRVTLLGLRK